MADIQPLFIITRPPPEHIGNPQGGVYSHDSGRIAGMAAQRSPRLGQVFLTDARMQQRIIDAVGARAGDVVLEIGAGPGNMTARLAASGARVVAVELDAKWAAALRQRFAAPTAGREGQDVGPAVEVLHKDILDVSIPEVARAAGRQRVKLFGNVPYYITSPILLHLFRYHGAIQDIVVMVQQEVGQRMVANPGDKDYGLLSI